MVQVGIPEGLLEGVVEHNEYGGSFYSFKGIPYAEPPIGDLRFKAPEPKQPWEGVRDAKKFGPVCHQHNILNPELGNMSEDCLYLNVYTPYEKLNFLLPVMVWIHGGGYTWGSGDDDLYGPQFLVRHGVVLVTFNYRLEALGFLSLHTADIPGNAGMKDQVAALRWVKRNIRNFGGDPDNITIFGESAGAGSVSYHLISPMSKGLFRRAITQSGGAASWWAQDFESRDKAVLLAKQLGFFSEDDKELYEFFKKQPAETLINLSLKIWRSQKPYEIDFAITNEKDFGQERFFYGDVIDALQNNLPEDIQILTGYTKDEGLMALFSSPIDDMIKEAKYFNTFFVPKWIQTHCVLADQLEVGRTMRKFYLKGGNVTEEAVVRFLSTDMFVYDIMLAGKQYAKKHNVYFYKFACTSDRNFIGPKLIPNKSYVSHADDLAYLFPVKLLKGQINENSEEFKMVTRMTTLWTNFAKYGNPTPDNTLGVQWKPFTLQKEDYLEIGSELKTGTAPDNEELQFWENIFKKYYPKHTF